MTLGGWLTIRDYFGTWASEYIVRFQYHAPTRAVAKWLTRQPELTDVAIGTNPNQLVLDPLALKLDLPRDIPASWFNAETAVVQVPAGPTILTALQAPGAEVRQLLGDTLQLQFRQPEFEVYAVRAAANGLPATTDRLALLDAQAPALPAQPGQPLVWRTHWEVNGAAPQRRLKLFLHVLNDKGEVIAGDDREDLNFATLSEGASFYQISRLTLPPDLPSGQYPVEVGWYNPETGERLKRADSSDRTLLPSLEVTAP